MSDLPKPENMPDEIQRLLNVGTKTNCPVDTIVAFAIVGDGIAVIPSGILNASRWSLIAVLATKEALALLNTVAQQQPYTEETKKP